VTPWALAGPTIPHLHTASGHYMSPLGVFTLLLLALVLDYSSVGEASIRDVVTFSVALPAIADGWSGQWLAQWTVGWLGGALQAGMRHSGSEYMATISGAGMVGVLLGMLALYATFCIIPPKLGARMKLNVPVVGRVHLGKLSNLTFQPGKKAGIEGVSDGEAPRRLCVKLWVCAAVLGLLWPLAMGWAGDLLQFEINSFAWVWKPLPNKLFGAP